MRPRCWLGLKLTAGRGWLRCWLLVPLCMRSTRCKQLVIGNATACRGRRAIPLTRIPWLTWCAPTRISCAQLRLTVLRSKRSKWLPEHKTLIWERARHTQRLRHSLREYFPAALEAFDDLDAPDTLELLGKAPEPASAAKLTYAQIAAALKRARRRDIDTKTTRIQDALRSQQLGRDPVITSAYAASTRSIVSVLVTLNEQIEVLQGQVEAYFGEHSDAESSMSLPGMGPLLGARVLGEFGDAPKRYTDAKARKNYAGTSPITRASGKKKVVVARFVHNDRLIDALILQAQSALRASPGARAYYDKQRDRDLSHNAALRQLANRLVGILHGCLKTRTNYDESTAWPQPNAPGQQQKDPDQQKAA